MPFSCKPGDAVLLRKPNQTVEHLWVILTEPEGDPSQVVMVNLTTQRSGSDTTVVLNVGEHPFIQHPTAVNYFDARFTPAEPLQQGVDAGFFSDLQCCEPGVLKKIQQGLLASRFTPKRIKNYCAQRFVS